jgi:transcription elongation factor GreA
MNNSPVYLTSEGRAKLEEELEVLRTSRRAEVAEMIKDAKEAGDISENAAYDEAKEQQALLEARIRQVEEMLHRAEQIPPTADKSRVGIGSTVTVAENGAGPETFRVVGSAEADPAHGTISNESPLGRALLGKSVGQSARYATPGGEMLEFEILRIS